MRKKISQHYIKQFNLDVDCLYAWGRKPSGRAQERYSQKLGKRLIRLEDGFIRSIDLNQGKPALSLCVDDLGIYYDSNTETRLEWLIKDKLKPSEIERAIQLQQSWRSKRISKYNSIRESSAPNEPFVLVVDQTAGDLSIKFGNASATSFQQMLAAALNEWPEHTIVVKIHPDVIHKKKRGHFSKADLLHPRVRISADGGGPCRLLEQCSAVYVVTSQVGFEGLIWGKCVHTFGMPFYAGWGLTKDRLATPHRREGVTVNISSLIHAALIRYPVYTHPETGESSTPEEIISWIDDQKNYCAAWPDQLEVFGFTPWKARQLRRFVPRSKHQTLRFRRSTSVPSHSCKAAIVWGGKELKTLSHDQLPVIRVEDGFIRSRGLGANLIEAQSWVFDSRGLHYDASQPSRLEEIINKGNALSATERRRIEQMLTSIREHQLSKYNLHGKPWQRSKESDNKAIILVLGQVETDASIQLGIPPEATVRTNEALLLAARECYPNDWIVYKPHPDVEAGMRKQLHMETIWDEEARNVCIQSLLRQADQVCVMTSLGGFEALIQGIPVRTWGIPFYAGWGLTQDALKSHPWLRRRLNRSLDLETLAYRCLIEYPSYVSRISNLRTSPEVAIQEILSAKENDPDHFTLEQSIFRWWGAFKSRYGNLRHK